MAIWRTIWLRETIPGGEWTPARKCMVTTPLLQSVAPMSRFTAKRQQPVFRRPSQSGSRFRGWGVVFAIALPLLFVPHSAEPAEFTVNYANADTRRWSCRLCDFDKADARGGTLAAGAMNAAKGEMRFGRDNGTDRAGSYLDLNADYRLSTKTGWLVEFAGRNLGLNSRDAALRIHRPRRYGVRVRHQEIPRNVARDGRSPFVVGDSLSLPNGWVPAYSTEGMTQWAEGSKTVDQATERSRSDIDAWFSVTPNLTLKTGYFRERKQGIEEAFRDAFYQASALPIPIDYRVDGTETGLHYANSTVSMAVSYSNYDFSNGAQALEWQNPYAGSVALGRSAAPPDNQSKTLSFVSRLRIGRRATLNATLARGEASQNVPFLPPSTNPSLDLEAIDQPGLNAKRKSLSGAVNLVVRATPRLRMSIVHVAAERRDRRRTIALTPVLGDLFATPEIVALGYSYKRSRTDITLRYRLPARLRVAAGFRHLDNSRSNLEIADNEENRVWAEVSGDLGAGWQVRVRHDNASRDAAPFEPITPNNPLTRRYYQASRRASEWSGGIRHDSPTSGFWAGFEANYREYDYPQSPLGLQRDATAGWLVDAGYATGKAIVLSGYYGVQTRESETAGSVAFPTRNWRYDTEDTVTTAGARLELHGFLRPAFDLTLDYAHSNGVGDYATVFEDRLSSFPSLISRHHSVDAHLRYAWRPRTALILRYRFEHYRAADWAVDGLTQDSIRNVLTFARSSPRYSNHLIALSVEAKL